MLVKQIYITEGVNAGIKPWRSVHELEENLRDNDGPPHLVFFVVVVSVVVFKWFIIYDLNDIKKLHGHQ